MIQLNSKKKINAKTVIEQVDKRETILKDIQNVWEKAKLKKELKSLALFSAFFASAVFGRVALQAIPSVEPIIPLAILTGLLFGAKEGATLGAGAYVVSNFLVWGLQGPWTLFQAIGAGGAGLLGGVFGKIKKINSKNFILLSVVGTLFFELIMNFSGGILGIGLLAGIFSLPLYFLLSLPFSLTHIATNAVFAKVFSPLLKLKEKEKNELQIVNYVKRSGKHTRSIRMYKSS